MFNREGSTGIGSLRAQPNNFYSNTPERLEMCDPNWPSTHECHPDRSIYGQGNNSSRLTDWEPIIIRSLRREAVCAVINTST